MHEYKKTWRLAVARSTHRGPEIAHPVRTSNEETPRRYVQHTPTMIGSMHIYTPMGIYRCIAL